MNGIIDDIQNEISNRQCKSDSISCPSFFQVVSALVNPSKDSHRSSHSKSHSKQKKSTSVSSPRSTFSDGSLDDTPSIHNKSNQYSVKMESIMSGGISPRSDYSVNSPSFPFLSQVVVMCI